MARYTFAGRYSAVRDGVKLGPWVEGDTVELDEELAEFIGRDSPGVLAPEEKPEARQATKAPADRMHRGRKDRGH